MLPQFVSIGFQVLFHSPPGVLFTFPSRYYFAIGHLVVFSLGGWSPLLPTGFLVSRGTLVPTMPVRISSTRLLLSSAGLSNPIRLYFSDHFCWPATPKIRELSVWAISFSLAATLKIDFSFSSSGYLDVSVHRVPSSQTIYSSEGDVLLHTPGFPIRTSVGQCLLATHHSFSQLTTSFFGSKCQGIRPTLFLA